jgi:hypothetical protein
MANEDFRVRFGADGFEQLLGQFKSLKSQSKDSAKGIESAFSGISAGFARLNAVLGGVGLAISAISLIGFIRQSAAAADALGDVAEGLGTTTRDLQALQFVAAQAGVDSDKFTAALSRLDHAVADFRAGKTENAAAFEALGLKPADFKGVTDSGKIFEIVGKKFAQFRNDSEKVAAAMALVGRGGAALIPVLNRVGNEGLGGIIKNGQDAGRVLNDQVLGQAGALSDEMDSLSASIRNAGIAFTAGLAPGVVDALNDIEGALGKNQNAFKVWGEEAGKDISNIAFLTKKVSGLSGVQLLINVGVSAFGKALGKDDFDSLIADIAKMQDKEKVAQNVIDAESKQHGPDLSSQLDLAAAAARVKAQQDATKALEIANKANEALRLKLELLAREGNLDAIALQRAQALSKGDLDRVAALDAQFAAQAKINVQLKEPVQRKGNRFDDFLTEQFATANDQLRQFRIDMERIDTESKLAGDSEEVTQRKITTLIKSRLPALKAQAELNVQLTKPGSKENLDAQENLNAVNAIELNLGKVVEAGRSFREDLRQSLGSDLANFFTDAITGARSLADAFDELGRSILNSVAALLAERAAGSLVNAIFGSPIVKKASGGAVHGPGSSTSDSIPALLSDGEFVVRAHAVAQPGVEELLRLINSGSAVPRLRSFDGLRRFSEGGPVSAPGGSASVNGSLSATIGVEEGLVVRHINAPAGQRAVIEAIAANPRAVKALLRL